MKNHCYGQGKSLTVKLNSWLARKIEFYTKVCTESYLIRTVLSVNTKVKIRRILHVVSNVVFNGCLCITSF